MPLWAPQVRFQPFSSKLFFMLTKLGCCPQPQWGDLTAQLLMHLLASSSLSHLIKCLPASSLYLDPYSNCPIQGGLLHLKKKNQTKQPSCIWKSLFVISWIPPASHTHTLIKQATGRQKSLHHQWLRTSYFLQVSWQKKHAEDNPQMKLSCK